MTIYEVAFWDGDGYEACRISFGFYSTREKAEEILNVFLTYDEWDRNNYFIAEHVVDVTPDWTLKHMEHIKANYEYNRKNSSSW